MDNPLIEFGRAARLAATSMICATHEKRCAALWNTAALLSVASKAILEANALDVEEARLAGRSTAFLDRLQLTPIRIEQMAEGMKKVAALPDPVGSCMEEWVRPNGLRIRQIRVPIGVVGFIYESRGTVTCDAAALCVKSGNAVILRGGKESARTNEKVAALIREGISKAGLPVDAVQLIPSGNREDVRSLCEMDAYVDVLIPRGGKGLVSAVSGYAKMPVLKHLDGICHTFVDESADLEMALDICDDAKTQRPGVCNAMETLLVHRAVASAFLPMLGERMAMRKVELRGCPESRKFLPESALAATDEDWRTEYEDLILSIKVVAGVEEAVDHVNAYGSHHSDAIVTSSDECASLFMARVDSACVYRNCSTRFSDGEEFGFGAEIGIGTGKIHARGPMGLRELTIYKYEILGDGQIKAPTEERGK